MTHEHGGQCKKRQINRLDPGDRCTSCFETRLPLLAAPFP